MYIVEKLAHVVTLVAFWCYAPCCFGQALVGHDTLGLQHPKFNSKELLAYLPSSSAMGTLHYTFGDSLTSIRSLLSSGKLLFYRVHLVNGCCIANRNCGPYEPVKNYTLASFDAALKKKDPHIINFIKASSKIYCDLQADFPNTKILISPVLEHRLSTTAFRNAADAVKAVCPDIQLVNNPLSANGERYKGAWLESHDARKPRDIVSFDGLEATDADISKWLKQTAKSKIAFIWSRGYNCRQAGGSFIDPRKRTKCVDSRTQELLVHLTDKRPKAPKPSFRCSFKALKSPSLWKPLAEDYPNVSDPRSNLPVTICDSLRSDLALVGVKGKAVGRMKYYGPFDKGKLNRYYSGSKGGINLSGYDVEQAINKLNGSPWAYLKQGNTCIGPFIPGLRGGSYREK